MYSFVSVSSLARIFFSFVSVRFSRISNLIYITFMNLVMALSGDPVVFCKIWSFVVRTFFGGGFFTCCLESFFGLLLIFWLSFRSSWLFERFTFAIAFIITWHLGLLAMCLFLQFPHLNFEVSFFCNLWLGVFQSKTGNVFRFYIA